MTFTTARPTDVRRQVAEKPPAAPVSQPEFQLVESSAGWQLTVTLTDRLREALANEGPSDEEISFAVRIKPNLVPGEPFTARLRVEGSAADEGSAQHGAHEAAEDREGRPRPQPA
jgi:hypothetical protein